MKRCSVLLLLFIFKFNAVFAADWIDGVPHYELTEKTDASIVWQDGKGFHILEEAGDGGPNGVYVLKINYDEILSTDDIEVSEPTSRTDKYFKVLNEDGINYLWFSSSSDFEQVPEGDLPAHTVRLKIESAVEFIYLNNKDDNSPRISSADGECSMNEDEPAGTRANCSFIIEDMDGCADQVTATISGASDLFQLEFDPPASQYPECLNPAAGVQGLTRKATATLAASEPLDFEKLSSYYLNIKIADMGGNTAGVNGLQFIFNVKDIPDQSPVWQSVLSSKTVDEEKENSFTVTAIDGDRSISADISYKITSKTAGSGPLNATEEDWFHIDDASSGIVFIDAIDRDLFQHNTYTISIVAFETEDEKSQTEPMAVTIFVTDINDNAPACKVRGLDGTDCSSYPKQTIDEGATGTFEYELEISDPDEGNGGWVDLKIEGAGSNFFRIIPTSAFQSGLFEVQYLPVDYETTTKFDINIIIQERGESTHAMSIPIQIDVKDINDNFPEFEPGTTTPINVKENTPPPTKVAAIQATDKDVEDQIEYFTTSTDFLIDSGTGDITVKTNDFFDYEKQTIVQIQVYANDGVHNVSATITFAVQDENDTPPTVALNKANSKVNESAAGVSTDLVVTAADQDTVHYLTASIDWNLSVATKDNTPVDIIEAGVNKWFSLVPVDGDPTSNTVKFNLVVDEPPKWEVADSVQLSIIATDANTTVNNPDSNPVVASIQVNNLDDNSPVFDCDSFKFHMREELDEDTRIGVAFAVDPDGPMSKIVYRIVSQTIDGTVKIDETTGLLTTGSTKYDRDTQPENYNLVIGATDGVNEETTCSLIILVDDINDNAPSASLISSTGPVKSILENATSGMELFDIEGDDIDVTDKFKNMYFTLKNNFEYFQLISDDDKTAKIIVNYSNNGFDYDDPNGPKEFQLTVTVCNNETDITGAILCNSSLVLTVKLLNVNDNDPVFPKLPNPDECIFSQDETVSASLILFTANDQILATDKDVGDNITYSIISTTCDETQSNVCDDSKDLFSLEAKSGSNSYNVLAKISLLDHYGHYKVGLQAKDDGGRTGTTAVVFCISDVNNNAPKFIPPFDSATGLELRIVQEGSKLLYYEDRRELDDIEVEDLDWRSNGDSTFTVVTEPLGMFDRQQDETNKMRLKPLVDFNDLTEKVVVTVKATDGTNDQNSQSSSISFTILRIITDPYEPQFNDPSQTIHFQENVTSEVEKCLPPANDPNNVNVPPTNQSKIYYYLPEENENSPFIVNKTTGCLVLTQLLDAAVQNDYVLKVRASNYGDLPADVPAPSNSILKVEVIVDDINDKSPVFSKKDFIVAVTNLDTDKVVATVNATDKDADDSVTYDIVETSIDIHLNPDSEIPNPLKIDADRGMIYVDYPQNVKSGNISFDVTATDKASHEDTAHILVYLVSDIYLMVFSFNNSRIAIDEAETKNKITDTLTNYFNLTCVSHQAKEWGNYANLSVYFQDGNFAPVDPNSDTIKIVRDNLNIMDGLKSELASFGCFLIGAGTDESIAADDGLLTALIVISAVLMVLFIALLTLYFIKTRRLSSLVKRITKANTVITETKGAELPNTNNFKEEGSNPVWNTDHRAQDLDNVSTTSSVDSGLIGIEDNPEFIEFYNKIVLKDQQGSSADPVQVQNSQTSAFEY